MIAIRGAITVETNKKEEVVSKVRKMLEEIIKRNELDKDDIISVLFTATKDIDCIYPAFVAREIGITQAALMCMQEMHIEGSLEMCIRVMVNAESNKKQKDVKHVYLEGAKVLRPDIK